MNQDDDSRDSHCFASCPTSALSTKTYEADVRSKNLPDKIVSSVVFVPVLVLKQIDFVGERNKWIELAIGNIALHLSPLMHFLTARRVQKWPEISYKVLALLNQGVDEGVQNINHNRTRRGYKRPT